MVSTQMKHVWFQTAFVIFLPGCICPDRLCNGSDYSSWAAVAGAGGGKLEDAHLTVAIIVTFYHKQYLQNHSLVSTNTQRIYLYFCSPVRRWDVYIVYLLDASQTLHSQVSSSGFPRRADSRVLGWARHGHRVEMDMAMRAARLGWRSETCRNWFVCIHEL